MFLIFVLDNPANDIDCDDGNSIPDVNVDVVNEDGQEPDISLRSK